MFLGFTGMSFLKIRNDSMNNLKPISADKQKKRDWKLEVNGHVIDDVNNMKLRSSRFGTLEYGETPQGYDSWCFEEIGGGGSVIIPYVILAPIVANVDYLDLEARQLYIGLVQQERYTTGGKAWNVPRGFLSDGETHFEAATREAGEEIGFNLAQRFRELPGNPVNWNNAFSITSGSGKGVRFYALEININELKKQPEFVDQYTFRNDVLKPVSKTGELIYSCRFIHYTDALAQPDILTLAGIGRLLPTVMSQLC